MTVFATQTHFTPDDLLRLDDGNLHELVDGRLVEKQMSFLANKTAGIITTCLTNFLKESGRGDVVPEQTFQCFPHAPGLVRRPDISFISADRLSGVPEEGHVPIPPDLAIEVVSPNDKIYELDEKLADYRLAGVTLVWVVNPKLRHVRVHRLDLTMSQLNDGDTLSGESVLPGFTVVVKELLPPPAADPLRTTP